MRILGVDPGLRITGYGCIDAPANTDAVIVEAGVIRLDRRTSNAGTPSVSARLAELYADYRDVLDRLKPRAVAVEIVFSHYKHPATSIVMAHARGVILLATRQAGLELIELRPNEIKRSLTAYGLARKDQMQRAVQAVFRLPEPPKPPDVADALGIALCAGRRLSAGLPAAPRSGRGTSARRATKELLALIKAD